MYTIGIDLGGTNIVAAVVDDKYNIVGKSKTPTNSPRSAEEIFDDIAKVCREAIDEAKLSISDISSVGMITFSCLKITSLIFIPSENFLIIVLIIQRGFSKVSRYYCVKI